MRSIHDCFKGRRQILFLLIVLTLSLSARGAFAQTTAFSYQGKLSDAGLPANGSYDFQFKLFDTPTVGAGIQQGGTITVPAVQVTGGIFTVNLDFGAVVFPGADRFLEIAARPAGGGAFTPLSPRQQVTSTPYAIRSLSAATADGLSLACLNCVTSSQIQNVQGSQVTGTIPVASVPAGSTNYIQNTSSQQATSNFNVSGDGTAAGTLSSNVVNSTTQYNIGGSRVLGNAGTQNTFVGINAGQNNAGSSNTFVGMNAGRANTTSSNNAFFGSGAGQANTGAQNSFFGRSAGQANTGGTSNSFFGFNAGLANTGGTNNSFFGQNAGSANNGIHNSFFGDSAGAANTASFNAFFGDSAGLSNTTGTANAFFGRGAGLSNTTGSDNSFFGFNAGLVNSGGQNSFFGRSAGATNTSGLSNSFFGYNAGVSNATGGNNSFFGQNAGAENTSGLHNSFFGDSAGAANTASFNAFFGDSAGSSNTTGTANAFFGRAAGLSNATGSDNSLFGFDAGLSNTGGQNSFFGRSAGQANTGGASNSFFGYNAGLSNTLGTNNSFLGQHAGGGNTTGTHNSSFGDNAGSTNVIGSNNTFIGASANVSFGAGNLDHATAIGAGALVSTSNTIVIGRETGNFNVNEHVIITGNLTVGGEINMSPIGGGTTPMCFNGVNKIGSCSSSLRYKTDVTAFFGGLSIITRLHPIMFTWKSDGKRDVGLGAERVAEVEPLFTFTNAKGEIEGVKYANLSVVFINAIKEQQVQIKSQQAQLARQQGDIEAVKRLVCPGHPNAALCRAGRPSKLRLKRQ